jgi:hypothetical protein
VVENQDGSRRTDSVITYSEIREEVFPLTVIAEERQEVFGLEKLNSNVCV